MIYELRTYTLKPGTVPDFEQRFAQRLPYRERYSKLGGFWHTKVGVLNQVIHVWPYEDVGQIREVRDALDKDADSQRLPGRRDLIVSLESEIFTPAPFVRPVGEGEQRMGDLYEMRIGTYRPGSMEQVLNEAAESIPYREKFSPLAACWYTELKLDGQSQGICMYYMWPYRDMAERDRIREEVCRDPESHWPPPSQEYLVRQENKLLTPAFFSPLK